MISWIIALWNWSPMMIIMLYFIVGYLTIGTAIRFRVQINQLYPADWEPIDDEDFISASLFCGYVMSWPILIGAFLVILIIYWTCRIITFCLRFGVKGFRRP